jgi:hypothetical protein
MSGACEHNQVIPYISKENSEQPEPESIVDFGKELTEREHRFLSLYFGGGLSQEKAMVAAGYHGYNKDYLGILARKVICKYELSVGDHRKIMRSLGWGEVQVIQSLIEAATDFRSETTKLQCEDRPG